MLSSGQVDSANARVDPVRGKLMSAAGTLAQADRGGSTKLCILLLAYSRLTERQLNLCDK